MSPSPGVFKMEVSELVANLQIEKMANVELLDSIDTALEQIARVLPAYERLRDSGRFDSPDFDYESLVSLGESILSNVYPLLYLRDEAVKRGLTMSTWPNEKLTKAIAGWTLKVIEQERGDFDAHFLQQMGIAPELSVLQL